MSLVMPLSETAETPPNLQAPNEGPAKIKHPNFLTRLNPFRKRPPEQPQEGKAEVERMVNYHRQALQNIEMHRATQAQVAGDSLAEEKHLDALVALGEKLTDKEIHRKAIHVATREAAERKEPLTEALVAEVEKRLKESQNNSSLNILL